MPPDPPSSSMLSSHTFTEEISTLSSQKSAPWLYITEHLPDCCTLTVLLEYLDHVIIIIVVYNYGCPGPGTQVALVLLLLLLQCNIQLQIYMCRWV